MHKTTPVPFAIASLFAAATATAQASVLDLQKSYHVGIYSGTVETPSGDLLLLAQVGDMDLLSTGSLSGALDTYETDIFGTVFTPNDPFSADYGVRPDGQIIFDFDPANPGTDLLGLWITPDGSVVHAARNQADVEAFSILAIEKSSGQSNAVLNGSYWFQSQRMEFAGADWNAFGEWGVATFDGAGGGTVVATELSTTPTGNSTQTSSGSFAYSVAADGSVTIDGSPGAVSADGEMLFLVEGGTGGGEVGMTIAVRIDSSYDFNALTGRYGLSGQGYTLSGGGSLPRTTTDFGELALLASSPTTGSWSVSGITVNGTQQGLTLSPLTGNGSATLAANGLMTLTDPFGSLEFHFSPNGRYCTGRAVEPRTNLFFAARQCAESLAYGTGTAGTGGAVPALSMKTFPTLGNAGWQYTVANGIGGGIGIVAVAFAPLPGVPALGGLIWVDPSTVGYSALVVLDGTLGAAGEGDAATGVPIPNNPGLIDVSLFAQSLLLDNAAPQGFSMSNGFQAVICR